MASDQDTGTSSFPAFGSTQQVRALGLHAVAARVDRISRRLIIRLYSGAQLEIPVGLIQTLHAGTATQLNEIEISPSGLGLYFPKLDADILVTGLLQGVMGSPAWMVEHQKRIERVKAEEKIRTLDEKSKSRHFQVQQLTKGVLRDSSKGGFIIRKTLVDDGLKLVARRLGASPKNKHKR